MNWTKTAPTKAGDWKWRAGEGGGEYAGNIVKTDQGLFFAFYLGFKPVTELEGEWLPLYGGDVLAAEKERAYKEGLRDGRQSDGEVDWYWNQSDSHKVATGETEPSL